MDRVIALTRVCARLWLMFAAATVMGASCAAASNNSIRTSKAYGSAKLIGLDWSKSAQSEQSLCFRWPVRGRVIGSFGPKVEPDGAINIAVLEDTPIKASEGGFVFYAGHFGSYGNLVILRHAGGYATVYAHASVILVNRNDMVERRQVIAKSGQTGNVTTPQLHFGIRKDTRLVDAMLYLERACD